MKDKRYFKEVKNGSFSKNFYIYISNYQKGRTLGTILTSLIILASIILGIITKEIVLDTFILAISMSSYFLGIDFLRTFNKIKKIGNNGSFSENNEIFYSMKNMSGPILILAKFFELYLPIILIFIIENKLMKIIVPLTFILINLILRLTNNFVENKASKIILKTMIPSFSFLIIGYILYYQTFIPIKIFDNVLLLLLTIIISTLKIILNQEYKWYKKYSKIVLSKKEKVFSYRNESSYLKINLKMERLKAKEKEEENAYLAKEAKNLEIAREKYAKGDISSIDKKYLKIIEAEEKEKKELLRQKTMNEKYNEIRLYQSGSAEREYYARLKKIEEEKKERLEAERLKNAKRNYSEGKISSISKEDLKTIEDEENKKYNVNINDSVKLNRASIRR